MRRRHSGQGRYDIQQPNVGNAHQRNARQVPNAGGIHCHAICRPTGPGFDLTQIDIGLTYVSELGGTNGATVQLVFDDGGDLPGSFIQSWILSNLPAIGTTMVQPRQMITGITGTMLTGGARYWLIAIGVSTSMAWQFADPEIVGPFAFSIDGGTNWTLVSGLGESAFDVLGTPLSTRVPEPMSVTLLGLGLAALAVARRRWTLSPS